MGLEMDGKGGGATDGGYVHTSLCSPPPYWTLLIIGGRLLFINNLTGLQGTFQPFPQSPFKTSTQPPALLAAAINDP